MSSQVDICNLALANIGKPNISDINERSTEAKYCRQFYEHTRDTLLGQYPWRFARKTQALAQLSSNPRSNVWPYAYSRPNDLLKLITVCREIDLQRVPAGDLSGYASLSNIADTKAGGVVYDTEGTVIYTELSPAFVVYIWKITDPTRFPPLFVEAFSWALTARLAMPVTRDAKQRNDAITLAKTALETAKVEDANEVRETSDITAEAIAARE